jgi:type IV pilus assembly protein PilF
LSQYLDAAQLAVANDRAVAAQAYLGAAVCALAVPDRPRARELLSKAMELQPNEAATLYRLADLSYAEGDYPAASAYLQRYHDRAGYSPESLWLGISIEERLGNAQRRRQYQDLLLSRFGNSEPARRLKSP